MLSIFCLLFVNFLFAFCPLFSCPLFQFLKDVCGDSFLFRNLSSKFGVHFLSTFCLLFVHFSGDDFLSNFCRFFVEFSGDEFSTSFGDEFRRRVFDEFSATSFGDEFWRRNFDELLSTFCPLFGRRPFVEFLYVLTSRATIDRSVVVCSHKCSSYCRSSVFSQVFSQVFELLVFKLLTTEWLSVLTSVAFILMCSLA